MKKKFNTKSEKNNKNYLENVILHNELLGQPFSFFLEAVINSVDIDKFGNYDLFYTLKQFTNLSPNQIRIPEYCIPILMDLIKILIGVAMNGENLSSNEISHYKNILKSDYEIMKMVESNFNPDSDVEYRVLEITGIDPFVYRQDYYKYYFEVIPIMIKLLGIRHTAYYFYFINKFIY